MTTQYGILNTNINIKGHSFDENTILKLWITKKIISIQPFFLSDKRFDVMWYMLDDNNFENYITLIEPSLMESVKNYGMPNLQSFFHTAN